MKPLFESHDARERSAAILRSWLGTPYRHGTMVRGRGTDCTLLVGAWLLELGVLVRVRTDYYAKDWYDHVEGDWLVDQLFDHFAHACWPGYAIVEVPAADLHGDVVGFATRQRDLTSHAGVLVHAAAGARPAVMVHCTPGRGVQEYELASCWVPRIRHVYRIMTED